MQYYFMYYYDIFLVIAHLVPVVAFSPIHYPKECVLFYGLKLEIYMDLTTRKNI